jgi:3-isopropylmalate/(R)-2-methylmalate dehydratase small subunit
VALPANDIDTDQIIPARFLKGTTKEGLGANLFADWRHRAAPDFVLDRPDARGAQILVAGDNFGCGSSREHAPWALTDWGFRAIVSTSFADIFKTNALKNGLLPVAVDAATHASILFAREVDPGLSLTIDLESQTITLPDGTMARFPIDAFAKHCLLEGIDELGYLLSFRAQIEAYEARR